MNHRSRVFAAALISVLATLVLAGAAAANPPQLTNEQTTASFYPCNPNQPATIANCPNPVPTVTANCNPIGDSTLSLTTTGGASPPFAGTYEETISWTIGPQIGPDSLPAQGAFFPFPGPPSESHGLPVGKLKGLTATFKITNGPTVIEGTKSFLNNDGNWGVCRTFNNEVTGSPVYGAAPLTGYFYTLNAGVLSYEVTSGIPAETGLAESYLDNSFATCCGPSVVNIATGHLMEGFGTTHPGPGTSGTAPTAQSPASTTVAPLPEVSLTFPSVGTGGTTTAVHLTDVPELPPNFQVGDPPAFYEISTTAGVTFPARLCINYGSQLAGTTPTILHYVGGSWEPLENIVVFGSPDFKVCGDTDSFSQFAAVFESTVSYDLSGPFEPVNTDMVNAAKAGQTIPVKFSLGGDYGSGIFAEGYPRSEGAQCDGGPVDSIETFSNGAGVTYDSTTGVYTYHWQTPKSWAGHCRQLTVLFNDGSEFVADFKFK